MQTCIHFAVCLLCFWGLWICGCFPCRLVCVCVFQSAYLRIVHTKAHPSIMWARRSIQAQVIPNQLSGSSLALCWSSSELISCPLMFTVCLRGNNGRFSFQTCHDIRETQSSAVHFSGAQFHSCSLHSRFAFTPRINLTTHTPRPCALRYFSCQLICMIILFYFFHIEA